MTEAAGWAWGGWVLGDLANAVDRASGAVGHGVEVLGVQVTPPTVQNGMPEVTIVVEEKVTLARLHEEVTAGLHPVRFLEDPTDEGWVAELNGVRLAAYLAGGERS